MCRVPAALVALSPLRNRLPTPIVVIRKCFCLSSLNGRKMRCDSRQESTLFDNFSNIYLSAAASKLLRKSI